MKILLVEDEHGIARVITRALREAAFAVDHATDAEKALVDFEVNEYDLVILDLLLPGIEGGGFAVCERIRDIDRQVPILMLTALDSAADKVRGLNIGADDYLVKPFQLEELLARVRALLRRAPHAKQVVLKVEDLSLDPATRMASRSDNDIALSPKEYALLEYLLRNQGRVVSQTELLEHVWDSNYQGMSNIVETYIRYLRIKLSPHGEPGLITTRRGAGYIIGA